MINVRFIAKILFKLLGPKLKKKDTKDDKAALKLVVDQSKVKDIFADDVKQENKVTKDKTQQRNKRQAYEPYYNGNEERGEFLDLFST